MDFVMGGLAAGGAAVVSNPFDVLKTRMQLQGELQARGRHSVVYKNVLHAGYLIAQNEGIKGLQKGLGVAVILHGTRNFFRLGTYQGIVRTGYLQNSNGEFIIYRCALASAFAGALGAFVGSPLFLVKTQIQSQAAANIAVGTQHGHKGAVHAIKFIYSQEGIKGLWRGASATMVRAVAGSSSQLTTFFVAKDYIKKIALFQDRAILTSFTASVFSALMQTIFINPFDVVSTRLYNQGVDAHGHGLLYTGLGDCFRKIYKTEGFSGFYKGVVANYMRMAPHGMVCLVLWDILKDLHKKYLESDKRTPGAIKS